MSEGNPLDVQLGDRTYQLVPQRIGRINRRLSSVLGLARQAGSGQVPAEITGQLYEVLLVFIPDLDPRWKLAGYPSAEAYEQKAAHDRDVAKARQDFTDRVVEERGFAKTLGFDDLPADIQAEFEPPTFVDPYDEAADKSPTPPQIMDAIEAIFNVHGGDRMVRLLKNFVGPEMIRGQIRRLQAEATLRRSQNLQPENGASASTSSSTPEPTPLPMDDEEPSALPSGEF